MGLWKTKLQQTHPQAEIMKKYMRAQGMQNKMHFPPRRDSNHSQKVPDMAATEGAYMLARAGNKERGEKGMNATATAERTGNGFVVVAACNRTHEMRGENGPANQASRCAAKTTAGDM